MKRVITNATIIDGTGGPSYVKNLVIDGDCIAAITEEVPDDAEVWDGTGLTVAPGFIDTHSHSDLNVLRKPQLLPKIMQGITTEVLGQDGISMAPLPEEYISAWRKNLAGLYGDSNSVDWHYKTTARYLELIEEAKPAINETYLVPHGNVRMEAMGLFNEQPNKATLEKMKDILRRELDAGAWGLSTGLIYMPCAYAETEELIELCKVVAEYDGVFVVHQRSEADDIVNSMKEVVRIGRESGVKVHFSHFKICGHDNWKLMPEVIKVLEEGEKEGIRISFDQYPYVAGSTMLGVILPPWAHDGGTNKLLERLTKKSAREKIIYDIKHGIPGWDNFVDFAGLTNIYITSVKTEKNRDAVGLSLTEFAKLRGKDVYDATFDLLYEEENAVGMVDFYGEEEQVKLMMKRPEMNVCTDGLMKGKPHPRVYGAFARVLGKYAREEQVIPMEKAVYKMTKKAAAVLGLKERGEIKEGYFADLVVFDSKTIKDMGTYTEPDQYPVGIKYVFVNGVPTVVNGEYQEDAVRSGRVLRRK